MANKGVIAMDKKSLISVIIPVYNTEKHLRKCLDSVIGQSYDNLEIIVVDDCSTDSSPQILEEYAAKDSRIKVLRHDVNSGLFQARLTGMEAASGDYFAFLDSDDYISLDYYRALIYRAVETESDITVGKIVHEDSSGYRYVHNAYDGFDFGILEGDSIFSEYFRQEGTCFIWHTIWNKLYSKRIIQKAISHYYNIKKHLIMTEDFAFSTVLFYYAKKLSCSHYAYYFYMQHSGASTSLVGGTPKFKKMISDLKTAFDFVEDFLKEKKVSNFITDLFEKWRKRYFRFWVDNIDHSTMNDSEKKEIVGFLMGSLNQSEIEYSVESDHYFYKVTSPWDARYNELLETFIKIPIEYVSFDIFDTLVTRPFFRPTDLFVLMNDYFCKLTGSDISFSEIRVQCEADCRTEQSVNSPTIQDITIEAIYEKLAKRLSLSSSDAKALMDKEKELEIKFCKTRQSVKNLYELALFIGKKVVITSDMYLDSDTIKEILCKNGYDNYEKLFLSSEIGLTKWTGDLYKYVTKQLEISSKDIMHIGDNWDSDHVMAQKNGWHSHFYPKTTECFFNWISDINAGNSTQLYFAPNGYFVNYEKGLEYFGIRCMLSVIANDVFDNPYLSFNYNTEFNMNEKMIGYYAMGMHMFGIVKWMIDDLSKNSDSTIHFIARDGHLPMNVYKEFQKIIPGLPKANYLPISRKALLPLLITSPNDLFDLPNWINIKSSTPEKIIELLKDILLPVSEQEYKDNNIVISAKFADLRSFHIFLEKFIPLAYSQEKVDKYRKKMAAYFKKIIKPGDSMFDIGYSGRSQVLLSKLLKQPLTAYYIHFNNEQNILACQKNQVTLKSFYEYTPSIAGAEREYLISESAPSCIGYDLSKDKLTPVYEPYNYLYVDSFAIGQVQNQAVRFVGDFLEIFGEYLDRLTFTNVNVSMPYEYFMHRSTDIDHMFFGSSVFEDEMYDGRETVYLNGIWHEHLNYHRFRGENAVSNARSFEQNVVYYNTPVSPEIEEIYQDGLFVALYRKLNKKYPKGSKGRERLKRMAAKFLK